MTAELLAQCRDTLGVSDETARAADPLWSRYLVSDMSVQAGRHVMNNDPATCLALNAVLRTVLDDIEKVLRPHSNTWPGSACCHERCRLAAASLAAIATALGVQEADRG